ncbi:hypothetical protein [Haloferax sp. YSMS24]|uniref:hypothetical protein n=1 Tax=Haloferax sp. YSMS24 TaxID=3388425 RepID=UPI00398C9903
MLAVDTVGIGWEPMTDNSGRLGERWELNRRTILKAAGAGIGASALISASGVGAANENTFSVDLIAGQNTVAGEVTVKKENGNLIVTFDTSGTSWELLATHLHVAGSEDDIPQTEKGNPKIGNFEYSGEPDSAPGNLAVYTVDVSGLSGEIVLAAHAEVQEVLIEAPYFAAGAQYTADQGVKKDGNPIPEARSDPEDALVKAYPDGEFFSLGFKRDDGGFKDEGGSIEITFDCPIVNGDGDDLKIWEVTFDPYPAESADVYAWYDGQWVYLGQADNSGQGSAGSPEAHTISTFDFGDPADPDYDEVESTEKIRIVDTTDPSLHNNNADAFDLDGVQVLQDCTNEETAWGAGEPFVDRGSWATYFTYVLDS